MEINPVPLHIPESKNQVNRPDVHARMHELKYEALAAQTAEMLACNIDELRQRGCAGNNDTTDDLRAQSESDFMAFLERDHRKSPAFKRMLYQQAVRWGVYAGSIVVNEKRDWSVRRETPWESLRLHAGFHKLEEVIARDFTDPREGRLYHLHLGSGDNSQVYLGNKDKRTIETHLGTQKRCEAWEQMGFGDKLYSSLDRLLEQFVLPEKVDSPATAIIIRVLTEAIQHQLGLRWSGKEGVDRDLNIIFELLADTKTLLRDVHFPEAIPGTFATLELSERFPADHPVGVLTMHEKQAACLEAYKLLLRLAGEPTNIVDLEIQEMEEHNARTKLGKIKDLIKRAKKCEKGSAVQIFEILAQELRVIVPAEERAAPLRSFADLRQAISHAKKHLFYAHQSAPKESERMQALAVLEKALPTDEGPSVDLEQAIRTFRDRTHAEERAISIESIGDLLIVLAQAKESTESELTQFIENKKTPTASDKTLIRTRMLRWIKTQLEHCGMTQPPRKLLTLSQRNINVLAQKRRNAKASQETDASVGQRKPHSFWTDRESTRMGGLSIADDITTMSLIERLKMEISGIPEERLLLAIFGKQTQEGNEGDHSLKGIATRADRHPGSFELLGDYFDPTFTRAIREQRQYKNLPEDPYRKRPVFQANHRSVISPIVLAGRSHTYVREGVPRDAHVRLNGELSRCESAMCEGYNVRRKGTTLTISKASHADLGEFVLDITSQLDLNERPHSFLKNFVPGRFGELSQIFPAESVHVLSAIRSDSHLPDAQAFASHIQDALGILAPGGCLVSEGIEQSYTQILRLVSIQDQHEFCVRVGIDSVSHKPILLFIQRRHPTKGFMNDTHRERIWGNKLIFVAPETLISLRPDIEIERSVREHLAACLSSSDGFRAIQHVLTYHADGKSNTKAQRILIAATANRLLLQHPHCIDAAFVALLKEQLLPTLTEAKRPALKKLIGDIRTFLQRYPLTENITTLQGESPEGLYAWLADILCALSKASDDNSLHMDMRTDDGSAASLRGADAADVLSRENNRRREAREKKERLDVVFLKSRIESALEELTAQAHYPERLEKLDLADLHGCSLFEIRQVLIRLLGADDTSETVGLFERVLIDMLLTTMRGREQVKKPTESSDGRSMLLNLGRNINLDAPPLLTRGDIAMVRITTTNAMRRTIERDREKRAGINSEHADGWIHPFSRMDAARDDFLRERSDLKRSHLPNNQEHQGPEAENRMLLKIHRIRNFVRAIVSETGGKKAILLLLIRHCKTNDILESKMRWLLGPELFEQAVRVTPVEFTGTSEQPDIDGLDEIEESTLQHIRDRNTLVIGTGSLQDPFDGHGVLYKERIGKPLFEASLDGSGSFHQLGICFHQQVMGDLAGELLFDRKIQTVPGPLEMGLVPITRTKRADNHPLFDGCGPRTTVAMAHGSHLSGNVDAFEASLKILAHSDVSGLPAIWQLEETMTGVQPHLEIDFSRAESTFDISDEILVSSDVKQILEETRSRSALLQSVYRHFSMERLERNFDAVNTHVSGHAMEILINALEYHLSQILKNLT